MTEKDLSALRLARIAGCAPEMFIRGEAWHATTNRVEGMQVDWANVACGMSWEDFALFCIGA